MEWPRTQVEKKSSLLIADDMPNLQDIFMKNKKAISTSNRRFTRQGTSKHNIIEPLGGATHNSMNNSMTLAESDSGPGIAKRRKTKEELAELRK